MFSCINAVVYAVIYAVIYAVTYAVTCTVICAVLYPIDVHTNCLDVSAHHIAIQTDSFVGPEVELGQSAVRKLPVGSW